MFEARVRSPRMKDIKVGGEKRHVKAQEMVTGVSKSHDRGGVLEMLEMGASARKDDRSGRPVT